jgi:glutamyl-tRNA reductase
VARQLVKLGARDLVLVNRSVQRAEALAAEVGGRAAPYEALHVEVAMCDVAIAATAATEPVVMYQQLRTAPRQLRDADVSVAVDGSLDAAQHRPATRRRAQASRWPTLMPCTCPVLAAEELRKAAAPAADAIVEAELESFMEWVSAAAAREAIRPLAEALTEICRRELTFAAGDAVAEHATSRIVAKLLARPMTKLRTAVAHGEASARLHHDARLVCSMDRRPAPRCSVRAKRR